MPDPLGGTVAFVFTDIEGSTRLAQSHPAAFRSLLHRHDTLLREVFRAGTLAGSAGDALFVVFGSVADALTAAAQGQRRLAAESWPDNVQVRVRMGVHVGHAEAAEDTYLGVEVHRAARICAAAHGRQILVSHAAASRTPPAGLSFRSLGTYRLKDFDDPQDLYQLTGADLDDAFPPPRTAEARIVSLPSEMTSLIGRDNELADIRQLVLDQQLVTLTGAGGSGKTRLAVRAAWDLAPQLRGPVVFVSLAPVTDADGAPSALATSLNLTGILATWDDAADVLRSQNALIVWDNAEHLSGFGHKLRTLREACDRVHHLVTSRSSLNIAGEQLYPVEPLALPAALELMVDRVQHQQPRYDLSAADRELRQIVERLDGLPLAIELAAGRLRSLSAPALVDRLDNLLDVLGDQGGDRPKRHETIRAALAWSYQLLDEADRRVFTSTAVFAGPARLEAIADVADADETAALDSLARLIDASLIQLHDSAEPRYRMLEPIRQFALEELARAHPVDASNPLSMAKRRMLEWYLQQSEQLHDQDERFIRAFRPELDNLRRTLSYGAELGEWQSAVRLCYLVAGLFRISGVGERLIGWVRGAERHQSAMTQRTRIELALVDVPHDEPNESRLVSLTSLADSNGDGDLRLTAWADLARHALETSDLDTADRALQHAAAVGLDPPWFAVDRPLLAALIAEAGGDADRARALWDETEEAARQTHDAVHLVRALWFIAGAALAENDGVRALKLMEEALAQDATWETWVGTELALRQTASAAAVLADQPLMAASHLQRALVIFDRVWSGDLYAGLPVMTVTVAATLALSGRLGAAATLYGWARAALPEPPIPDRHATQRQAQIIEERLGSQFMDEAAEQLDQAQVLRLSLDEVAVILELAADRSPAPP